MTMQIPLVQSDLNLNGAWSIGPDDYACLLGYIDRASVNSILELGSGQSTLQLAKDFPKASILSLENILDIAEKNQVLLNSASRYAKILYSPIKAQPKMGGYFMTYDMEQVKSATDLDLLIVDGPVESLYPVGREAALYFLFDHLRVGAIIGLDDYHRKSAKEAVKNWTFVFGSSLRIKEETSSFVVLEKVSECKKTRTNFTLYVHIYYYFLKALYKGTHRSNSRRK